MKDSRTNIVSALIIREGEVGGIVANDCAQIRQMMLSGLNKQESDS